MNASSASAAVLLALLAATATAAPDSIADASESIVRRVTSSGEEGQTSLEEAFDWHQLRLERRRKALEDTVFKFNFRTYYFDRDKFDDTESEAWAAGGWAGVKTGYFLDHIAFGLTGYTSQHLSGDEDKDGSLLLAPGQEGYTALGELYTDIRIIDDLNLLIGRKEFDTPYINRNDTRMTPNTFEAAVLMGKAKFEDGATLKYGAGYFDQIKERNSDDFVSMSRDAGADVERGVATAGALYQKGGFSIGAIDYFSADIINIAYLEAKYEMPVCTDWKLKFAAQYSDQQAVGDNLLAGDDFSARQFGLKAELDVGQALFTTAFTSNSGDIDMQYPWSGYPGYTGSQVQDFNRDGEDAFLIRAGYEIEQVPGLGAYAQGTFGTDPDAAGLARHDEYDLNLQWAPPDGVLKGLALRLRYGIVEQHDSASDTLTDFRVICNYAISF